MNYARRERGASGRYVSAEQCDTRRSRALEDGIAVLAGAGIGVALMYLMDPEHGEQRRAYAKKRARQLMENAGSTVSTAMGATAGGASKMTSRLGDRLSSAYDSASDYAADASSNAASGASGFFGNVAGYGRDFYGRARHAMGNVFHRASDATSDASDRAGGWLSSAKDYAASYVPHVETQADRDRHFWGQMACALASLGLGAGIVYYIDPDRGRTRRAQLTDKFARFTNETGDFFRRTGRHVSNKFRGYAAETGTMTRNMMGSAEQVSDRKLTDRIRAELGHATDRASDINVICYGGRVTLSGNAPVAEIDRIVAVVTGVQGVSGVENRLNSGVGV